MSIHYHAIKHLDAAVELAAAGTYNSLRYAALELRFAIEQLVYKFLPYYKDEIPDEIFDEWRPQVILDALVDANPDLPHSMRLVIAPENERGEPGQAFLLGTQTGLVPRVLRAAHHRLGGFLHAPKSGGEHDIAKLKRSVEQVIRVLEPYRKDGTIANFAVRHHLTCECGRSLSRRARALAKSPFVRCPNSSCRRVYESKGTKGEQAVWEKVTQEFVCPSCKEKNNFSPAQLEAGARLECGTCKRIWRLEPRLVAMLEVSSAG